MSGHSKWANIKHRKSAADSRRGAVFAKLIKEIMVSARIGGGNPDGNSRLRLAVEKARAQSVPKDTIERAVKKGTGEVAGTTIEEVVYEGYGPGGAAVFVECATDNRTRTVAELRTIFSKNGGNLGESGSVAWIFERRGVLRIPASGADEETLFEMALDAGADDIREDEDEFIVIAAPENFASVRDKLAGRGVNCREAGVERLPKNTVSIEDEETARRLLGLMEALEDHDDVQHAWSNFDIDETLLERIAG